MKNKQVEKWVTNRRPDDVSGSLANVWLFDIQIRAGHWVFRLVIPKFVPRNKSGRIEDGEYLEYRWNEVR